MQASKLVVIGKHKIDFINVELPRLQSRQVMVKGVVSGISHATELAVINKTTPTFHKYWQDSLRCFVNGNPSKKYPSSLGYEYVGKVVEVGDDIDNIQLGDLVWMDAPHQTFNVLDVDKTPHLLLDAKTNANIATFLALTRVALAGVHDAKPKIGDSAFVSGLGTVGLLVVQLLKLAGVNVVVASDPFAIRRNKAQEFGAVVVNPRVEDPGIFAKRYTGNGVDFAIECSGVSQALQDAIKACATAGTVVTVASYRDGASQLFLGEEWHRNRITLLSSMSVNGCPHRDYPLWNIGRLNQTSLALLQTGKVEVKSLISHTFPFTEAVKAYELIEMHPEETIKVILSYN